MARGNNKNCQGIRRRVDYIVGLGVGLNASISCERCRCGETVGARVWLEIGAKGRFKTSVDFSIRPVQLKLNSEFSFFLSLSERGSSLTLLVDSLNV